MNATNQRLRLLVLALLALAVAACSRPSPRLSEVPARQAPWSKECVDELARTPVQQNGRVKPLSVWAAFTLYSVHGRRDLKYEYGAESSPQKVTLEPIEWLLDVWCYPEQADEYPLFRIENVAVLDALGIDNEGQKQGFEFLSFHQAAASFEQLRTLGNEYAALDAGKRSEVQEHIVQLWRHFREYDNLRSTLDPLRYPIAVPDAELQQLFGGQQVKLAELLAKGPEFRKRIAAMGDAVVSDDQMVVMLDLLQRMFRFDSGAALVPPLSAMTPGGVGEPEWLYVGGGAELVLREVEGPTRDAVFGLDRAVNGADHAAIEASLMRYAEAVITAAAPLPGAAHVDLEAMYYRKAWHYQSIHWFLFGFVLAAACWMFPKSRLLWWGSVGVTVFALGLLSYDVALRCVITGRPPIKNLYDTFLFIAAIAVLVSVIAEFVLPRRIALAVAPVLGALLVMFARLFEVSKGEDTMDPLQAVLDSNFWLATHVTTINMGYAAGLAASSFAVAWVVNRVLRLSDVNGKEAKAMLRITYGITCFGLAFAVVGTILGGVWANDSWGRFWGWDPKENGALLICLSQIALLHARMSGWVRDAGFALWSVVTGMVVTFSWFHVNLLGVGLHSYGFSSGLRTAVWMTYCIYGGTALVGFIDVLARPKPAPIARLAEDEDAELVPPPLPAKS
ncbi:MAG: cytochrome c biogenesis protein CcsA [Planctomycetes bacterium]|nr:cytochrome c biogenesis protein CcsA [Planctomycetota bacterium]